MATKRAVKSKRKATRKSPVTKTVRTTGRWPKKDEKIVVLSNDQSTHLLVWSQDKQDYIDVPLSKQDTNAVVYHLTMNKGYDAGAVRVKQDMVSEKAEPFTGRSSVENAQPMRPEEGSAVKKEATEESGVMNELIHQHYRLNAGFNNAVIRLSALVANLTGGAASEGAKPPDMPKTNRLACWENNIRTQDELINLLNDNVSILAKLI